MLFIKTRKILYFEYIEDNLILNFNGVLVLKSKIISIKSSDSLFVLKTSKDKENEYHFRIISKDTLIYSKGNRI